MKNLALAKNPSQILTNQIRILPPSTNLNVKEALLVNNKIRFVVPKTSVAPEKILVSKKILDSLDHVHIDPLEASIKLEIPSLEDEILEE